MALTVEEIKKQTKTYFSTAEKYGIMNEELMNYLGDQFIAAPASDRTDKHNAFEGGLIDFIMKVTKRALALNEAWPENIQVTKESIIKVCFLHQIGKAHLYIARTSDWHIKNGMPYEFNNNLVSMHYGERAAYIAMHYGIQLSEDEYQAIINFGKDSSDKQAQNHTRPLGVLLRHANEVTILEVSE